MLSSAEHKKSFITSGPGLTPRSVAVQLPPELVQSDICFLNDVYIYRAYLLIYLAIRYMYMARNSLIMYSARENKLHIIRETTKPKTSLHNVLSHRSLLSSNTHIVVQINYCDISHGMRFPTMWYVRPAKAQISLRIRADWSEPLLVA